MKICSVCKKEFDYALFPKNRSTKDGFHGSCKKCHVLDTRKNYLKYRDIKLAKQSVRKAKKKGYVGLDISTKDPNFTSEVCQICNKTGKLVLDHCHITGVFRGIICHGCNLGLSYFKDNKDIILSAFEYIKKY